MRRARPYRGENPGPGKDVHGELDHRPGIREHALKIADVYIPIKRRATLEQKRVDELAADAHDCIMVRFLSTYRIQGCGALIRARWQAPPWTASLSHH